MSFLCRSHFHPPGCRKFRPLQKLRVPPAKNLAFPSNVGWIPKPIGFAVKLWRKPKIQWFIIMLPILENGYILSTASIWFSYLQISGTTGDHQSLGIFTFRYIQHYPAIHPSNRGGLCTVYRILSSSMWRCPKKCGLTTKKKTKVGP
jgi:hypothetical protein